MWRYFVYFSLKKELYSRRVASILIGLHALWRNHSLKGKFGWLCSLGTLKETNLERTRELGPRTDQQCHRWWERRVTLLQDYMNDDDFDGILKTVETKRKTIVWECNVWNKTIQEESVICDACLLWYHYTCVGLRRNPRKNVWFCHMCLKKQYSISTGWLPRWQAWKQKLSNPNLIICILLFWKFKILLFSFNTLFL